MNIAIAFGAGILSFLSPCVLPLVPAFLVNMAGEAALAGTQRGRTLAHAFAFVLGFSAVFTLLWIAIALVGALAGDMVFWLQRAGGLLLVVLGMHMLGLITIPLPSGPAKIEIRYALTGDVKLGYLCSVLSVVLLIALILDDNRKLRPLIRKLCEG